MKKPSSGNGKAGIFCTAFGKITSWVKHSAGLPTINPEGYRFK